ncbi:MAG: carboxylating nicotinate-nucleotide diphosphorylase [candidate division WOR-3 bacterium]|nr:MAG: carboxylating nicotinate-nucleotide diphosphorylase [candidate division WOR-3 bacterium]
MKEKSVKPKQADKQTRQFMSIVKRALREDIGRGDITTDAIISETDRALGVIFAKEEGVLCGVDIAQCVFEQIDETIDFQKQLSDGSHLSPGGTIAILIGKASTCLKGERTALNFLQHLSGIATATRQFVDAAKGNVKILDTRKTTPGIRIMQKYAVRVGGGSNHRSGLYDMVMIKDNHIQIAGGISEAVKRVRNRKRKQFIEVEVQTMEELKEAIGLEVNRIMLDNMRESQIAKAVDLVRRSSSNLEIEISGGVELQNIDELAEYGADFVSIGALTHSARAIDIALKMKPLGPKAI